MTVMRRFLPRFLPLVAAVVAGVLLQIRARDLERLKEITADERAFVQVEVGRIEATTASAAADALFLSELAFQGGIGRAASTGSLDGYEATEAIRRGESATTGRPLRIVALSAYAMKEEVQKSLDAGYDDHLTKPIKKARILEAIVEAQVLRSVNQAA